MTKMRQAVRWLLADPSRKQTTAARMFGVNQGNLSKAIREARASKRMAGEVCVMCGQLLPHARGPYDDIETPQQAAPAPDIDLATGCAPGFIPVTPAMATGFVPVTPRHATPQPVLNPEVAKFIAERDAAIRARDAAEASKLPTIPDEHAAARTVWEIKPE